MPEQQRNAPSSFRRAVPLGALAAGFGFAGLSLAQSAPPAPAAEPATLPTVRAKAAAEPTGKDSVQATTTRLGKGNQELRDVPQSITVVTERLIDDRNLDTLKDALKNTAGISFQAAEGGEEDIRLRGFSLQATGDIFMDGIRDPAFYERDSFNWDRLELLRGSASMLFGRGSTGGAVNQVSKQPLLLDRNEIAVTAGSGDELRATGDFNVKTGDDAAFRVALMGHIADNYGAKTDKVGIAPTYRFGIGTADEFSVGLYYLHNDNGINYGMPWLTPAPGRTDRVLLPVDPKAYYGMASDYSKGGVTAGTVTHTHRFVGGGELRTSLRQAHYERDQRASAIRFCTFNPSTGTNPDCPAAVTAENLSDATILTRGNNVKIQDMDTTYLQSDYSGRFKWFGLDHSVQAGVDAAHEQFQNYSALPLVKPRTTIGTPDDGASVDESQRVTFPNRDFKAKALGVYAQDLLQIAPTWKLLGGLRWDRFEGDYHAEPTTGTNPQPALDLGRSDSLWSHRLGVLWQPTALSSFHLSYGTSFNTSGDTYQYDTGTARVDPEKSRNIELGAKLDSADGRFSSRFALFHSTKYNERNRDSESVNELNYVLSGERHASGLEIDLAGRLTPAWEVFASYAWIPDAKVDKASAAAPAGETEGSRPGLTPLSSGTVWSTYKLTPSWRLGAGLNWRSAMAPQGITTFKAPGYLTADLMAEYTTGALAFKFNVTNIADKLYADMLYRGHYIAGKPRTFQVTTTYTF